MDLSLTPEQEMFKNTAKDFMSKECPITLVRQVDDHGDGFSRELWQKIAALGWVGMTIPEAYGGGGHSWTDLGVVYEEMGRGLLPSPHHSSAVVCAQIILEGGSEAQKRALLPGIASGERIFALAFTEPDYGWGPEHVRLTAAPSAESFRLYGTKLFAHDVHIADQIIVPVRTRPNSDSAYGITLLLVDPNAPGLSRRIVIGWDGERQSELVFDAVEVSRENVIGRVDEGWPVLQRALLPAAAVLCSYMVGGMQEVFEWTVNYCRTRQQFGAPIGTFQRVQDHVVEIVNQLDAARWTTSEALWKIDNRQSGLDEAVAIAKAVTSEAYDEATFHSHEIHAGIGISQEYGLYLYTKKARTLAAYLGDATHHRGTIAGVLKL